MWTLSPLVQLILQSDAISLLVLLALFLMSTACWGTFVYHMLWLRMWQRQLSSLMGRSRASTLAGHQQGYDAVRGTCIDSAYVQSTSILRAWSELAQHKIIDQADWDFLADDLEQLRDSIHEQTQPGTTLLMTAVEASPLLGLFGTVWGLIHSFMRIAQFQSADIVTVAPGIAEALITTLAGLLVAMPALGMFHALNTRQRSLQRQIDQFIDRCAYVARAIALAAPSEFMPLKDQYAQNTTQKTHS